MNNETTELLRELAAKLGTTVDHLWAVMLRQAFISGCCDLLFYVATAALICYVARKTPEWLDRDEPEEAQEFVWMLSRLALVGMALICALACVLNFSDTVTAFVNPEYWALKRILEAAK